METCKWQLKIVISKRTFHRFTTLQYLTNFIISRPVSVYKCQHYVAGSFDNTKQKSNLIVEMLFLFCLQVELISSSIHSSFSLDFEGTVTFDCFYSYYLIIALYVMWIQQFLLPNNKLMYVCMYVCMYVYNCLQPVLHFCFCCSFSVNLFRCFGENSYTLASQFSSQRGELAGQLPSLRNVF